MKYKYVIESKNYEDFASGRVLYNQKGATAFPVRLASEIFLRSKYYLEQKGINHPISIYDPCCGGAYLLTTLAFLHSKNISKILASDVDEDIINLAKRNLGLLTTEGINSRIDELNEYINEYKKKSHKEALNSALKLKAVQKNINAFLDIKCFKANALQNNSFEFKVDLIMTDLPYGNITEWKNTTHNNNIEVLLNNFYKILKPNSILSIISNKRQKIKHTKYNRIKHVTVGKRRVSFLEPLKPRKNH